MGETEVRTITVPTEDGRISVVEFERSERVESDCGNHQWWTISISDELVSRHPEGVVAILAQAIGQMKADR